MEIPFCKLNTWASNWTIRYETILKEKTSDMKI